VLTDYKMEPFDGVDLVRQLREIDEAANCLIMTACPDAKIHAYVAATGLSGIIKKPIRPTNLAEQLRVALYKRRGATERLGEIAVTNRMDRCIALLGQSYQICQVRKQIADLLNKKNPFFIEGPFGVGKPDIVRFIHNAGCYANSPLVIYACDELSPGEFNEKLIAPDGSFGSCVQAAEHGMLVLTHIEAIPLDLQQLLARQIDALSEICRLTTWANALMDDLLAAGKVAEELYFALSLETLHVPALSERPTDIEEIVRYIAASPTDFKLERRLTKDELDLLVADLRRCTLEGNLRELIQKVRQACACPATAV